MLQRQGWALRRYVLNTSYFSLLERMDADQRRTLIYLIAWTLVPLLYVTAFSLL